MARLRSIRRPCDGEAWNYRAAGLVVGAGDSLKLTISGKTG